MTAGGCPARVVGRSPPGDYFPYPVRGLDEHSLLKREAVWSSLEILLPWVSGVPGVGWKMVIFACFSGFFPPKTRVTRSSATSPRRGDVPSFQRPRCFPLRARSNRCLFAIEAENTGPGVILIRRYTAARLGRGRPGAAACWPWLVSGCSTCSREIRNLRRPEPS